MAGGTYPVFESQWKQVILLWLGRKDVDEVQKDEFIGTSVGFEDETGRDFNGFRTLFLAAARIAEFQERSRADEIVAQLVMVAFGFFSQELGEWLTWPKEVARAAMVALEDTEPERVVDALVQLIGNAQSQEARRQAAWTLGKIGRGNDTAIAALVELTHTDESKSIRWQAIWSLEEIGRGNPALSRSPRDFFVCRQQATGNRQQEGSKVSKNAQSKERFFI